MRKLILMCLLFSSVSFSAGIQMQEMIRIVSKPEIPVKTDWEIFVEALIQVESEGNPKAVGKHNDVGILQITPIYVEEVNRIIGQNKYSLSSRNSIEKSLEMFEIYQGYYNPEKIISKAIRLHNPRAGVEYKNKVRSEMSKIKQENV